jgi:DNA-repair protein XRCC3
MEPSTSKSRRPAPAAASSSTTRVLRGGDPDRASSLSNVLRASQLKQDYLTTGSLALDEFLQGGIPTFGVTEVSGEGSSGKTQLCLQLTLMAQLPESAGGLNSGSIYMNTQQLFPSQRHFELSQHFKTKYGSALPPNPMDRVLVEHVAESGTLLNYLETRIPTLLRDSDKKFRLLILDSIASLFRADYDKKKPEMTKRTQEIRLIGIALHKLSRDFKLAVVVVNQVSASFALGENIPSLGLVWTNLVTTRLFLSRSGSNRILSVKFAPHIPNRSIPFEITTSEGIQAAVPPFEKSLS